MEVFSGANELSLIEFYFPSLSALSPGWVYGLEKFQISQSSILVRQSVGQCVTLRHCI